MTRLIALTGKAVWRCARPAAWAAAIRWTGEPVLSRYNSPMTPWFMRRNEIWLKLD